MISKLQKEKPIKELLDFCILNINKPSGLTSFKTSEKIKKILKIKKTGHFGTLDPKVTGVLPIALNRACKLTNFFIKKDKEYIGEMYINKKISKNKLEKEMNNFIGKIMQKPPVKSRVKRVLRERMVNKFEIIKIKKAKKGIIAKFHSDVQAGTYIRKLISDLGEKIGGAHMINLKRIRAGIFNEKNSYTIEEVQKAFEKYKKGDETFLRKLLIPAEIIQQLITKVDIKEESINQLLNGKPLMKKDIFKKIPNSDLISVFYKEKFIGIYERIKKGEIIAKPKFIFN